MSTPGNQSLVLWQLAQHGHIIEHKRAERTKSRLLRSESRYIEHKRAERTLPTRRRMRQPWQAGKGSRASGGAGQRRGGRLSPEKYHPTSRTVPEFENANTDSPIQNNIVDIPE